LNAGNTVSMVNDEQLFLQVQHGRREALEELVSRYYAPLRGYFYRLCGENLQDAEDFTQETFFRLLRYKGDVPHCFRFWVYTVARNLAYDRFRSSGYQREQVGLEDNLEDEADCTVSVGLNQERFTEEDALMRSEAMTVKERLKSLPVSQREVIILHFYQGLKLEEISQIMGTPLGTVKSRLFHGLASLKAQFKEVDYV